MAEGDRSSGVAWAASEALKAISGIGAVNSAPAEAEIEALLAELQSDDVSRRLDAARALGAAGRNTPEVVNALKVAAALDGSRYVRVAAFNALAALGLSVAELRPYVAPATEKTRNEKTRRFVIGFAGWWLLSGLALVVIDRGSPYDLFSWGIFIFPIQIIVLIVLAFRQGWVALGMLSAIALNLMISLVMGIGVTGWCFVPFWASSADFW